MGERRCCGLTAWTGPLQHWDAPFVAGFLEALASRVAPGNAADMRRLAGEGLEGDVLLGQLAPRVLERHFAADHELRAASLRSYLKPWTPAP